LPHVAKTGHNGQDSLYVGIGRNVGPRDCQRMEHDPLDSSAAHKRVQDVSEFMNGHHRQPREADRKQNQQRLGGLGPAAIQSQPFVWMSILYCSAAPWYRAGRPWQLRLRSSAPYEGTTFQTKLIAGWHSRGQECHLHGVLAVAADGCGLFAACGRRHCQDGPGPQDRGRMCRTNEPAL